ncbi:MAG TPA: NAD(P)/FAD-dependent oxidoreductase [Candidatus Krumholzibacteria bacterium]|nr:NAD(P)/FAD-dependent oxidoreductase [Candidatus Krumholzibacteria bacterium]
MAKYDAIIVGAGHNGLVAAAYLAKAGRRVLVVEQRPVIGGAAVTEEVFPGFKFSVCSYVVSLFRPHIIRELELTKHGMQLIPLECSFTPHLEGPGLVRWADANRTRREVSRFSRKDAEIYPEFALAMSKMSFFVKHIIDSPPPDVGSLHPRELSQLSRLFGHLRDLGPDMMELHAQLLTMSGVDFLKMWFESDALLAPMSCSGIIGTFLGVHSPGTAYVLLHHYMGEIDGAFRSWGFSKGGTGGVSQAIANAAIHHGATIRTSAPVARVVVKHGRAKGVVLENGEEIDAKVVISNADPRRTFLTMVGENHFDASFTEQVKRYKYRGSSGKVNLALDRFPDFTCRPGDGVHVRGDIAVAPSLEYLERAYDDAKYGEFSKRPYLNVVVPSLVDPSVAPPGKHVMSIFVQYAPYHLKAGAETWPKRREEFGDTVVDTLAEYCPGLKDSILHRQVLTPWDLEHEIGLTEGNIFQGELSLEQLLFLRPVQGWSRYRTPVRGLWLCGSGAHPGGGIMGAPGELCAKSLMNEGEV